MGSPEPRVGLRCNDCRQEGGEFRTFTRSAAEAHTSRTRHHDFREVQFHRKRRSTADRTRARRDREAREQAEAEQGQQRLEQQLEQRQRREQEALERRQADFEKKLAAALRGQGS